MWRKDIVVMTMEIKSDLNKIMEDKGMKQRYLAKKAGISETTLSLLVRGKQLPTLPVAYRIAEVLYMKVEEIWIKK
jgi:DNA-binding XRE family transcriptional regulator